MSNDTLLAHNSEFLIDGVPQIVTADFPFADGERKNWHEATEEELAAYDKYLSDFDARRHARHEDRRNDAVEALIDAEYASDEYGTYVFTKDELREILASAYNAGAGI
jgi:hypothetical protein